MAKWQEVIKLILDKTGFLSEDEKLSITNLAVIIFVSITAFRALFSGMQIHIGTEFQWTVEAIDIPSTLPMLFSLLNYSHKRDVINKAIANNTDKENS